MPLHLLSSHCLRLFLKRLLKFRSHFFGLRDQELLKLSLLVVKALLRLIEFHLQVRQACFRVVQLGHQGFHQLFVDSETVFRPGIRLRQHLDFGVAFLQHLVRPVDLVCRFLVQCDNFFIKSYDFSIPIVDCTLQIGAMLATFILEQLLLQVLDQVLLLVINRPQGVQVLLRIRVV